MRGRWFAASLAILVVLVGQVLDTPRASAAVTSTLTLNAEPAEATVGDQISLSGTLTFGDASSSADQTITLSREDASGINPLDDATTAGDGSYVLTDTVDVGGSSTYHASFAGAEDVGSSEAFDTVSVSKLATNVSVHVSDTDVIYGASVRITGHLGKGTDRRALELYATPDGRKRVLVKKAKVNADGFLSASYDPSRDTTFTARYAGDLAHKSAGDSAVTRVRVILNAKLTKYVSTSGKYRIYKGGSYAHCEVHVSPNHADDKVHATLQAYTGGSWKAIDTGSFRLNASSNVKFVIRGSSNVNFRVMVKLPTHADHLGDASPWRYLRFS